MHYIKSFAVNESLTILCYIYNITNTFRMLNMRIKRILLATSLLTGSFFCVQNASAADDGATTKTCGEDTAQTGCGEDTAQTGSPVTGYYGSTGGSSSSE